MSIQDEILRVTGGPTVQDGKATHFGKTDNETLQEAEFRWLSEVPRLGTGNTIAERWISALNTLGIISGPKQLNDARFEYWSSQ